MTERLFFALWPDEAVRQGLAAIIQQLPAHHGRSPHREDLHITLTFLGDVDTAQRICAERAGDEVPGEPFRLRLDHIGYWPRPRVLWCAPSAVPEPLLRLVSALKDRLRDCGFKPEQRPFAPHITLVRKARGARPRELHDPLDWWVQDFALIVSQLGQDPPRYQVLKRWVLDS